MCHRNTTKGIRTATGGRVAHMLRGDGACDETEAMSQTTGAAMTAATTTNNGSGGTSLTGEGRLPFGYIRTGDLLLMNRDCLTMRNPFALGVCLLTKTENRFDHVGMLVKLADKELAQMPRTRAAVAQTSPSSTYVLETNIKGVTLYAAEHRVARSSAREIAVRALHTDAVKEATVQRRVLREVERSHDIPYQTRLAAFLPSIFSPPDKMDRIEAAHKINQLQHEIDALAAMADGGLPTLYDKLALTYRRAQLFLAETYFPHLIPPPPPPSVDGHTMQGVATTRTSAMVDKGPVVDWTGRHLWVDGVNEATAMVCSELICNVWLRAGLTTGFVPASSMRPFDFFDDSRFNFIDASTHLGALTVLKHDIAHAKNWKADDHVALQRRSNEPFALTESARLGFVNEIRQAAQLPPLATLPATEEPTTSVVSGVLNPNWLVQSSAYGMTLRELPLRLFGCGVLFSLCHILCAPFTLRAVEGQVGLLLMHGTVWSLTGGMLARNLSFAAAQAIVAAAAIRLFFHPVLSDVMARRENLATTRGWWRRQHLVDTRHPYYAVVGTVWLSSLVAHVVTTPIYNATIATHFGPPRIGPLPRSLLMRGAVSLAPFSLLLPFQAGWLAWYETVGAAVIPTRSSVLRPREDLLRRPDWPHLRKDALFGAFGATLLVDVLFYRRQLRIQRGLIAALYFPHRSPSVGRSRLAGFRYRFAGNLVICATTMITLSIAHLL